jgi:alginate O-acetyltransferase complex protein AlgI
VLFNSGPFLFLFLPITLVGYFLISKTHLYYLSATWLFVCSLVFYRWDDPARLISLILISIAFNYIFGRELVRIHSKLLLFIAVAANLGLLTYFKYAFFITSNLSVFNMPVVNVALPIGISFFTFTQIAFLIDAYRGEAKEYNPVHYGLFVTFFPHLIAGPILHHKEMMPQFARRETYNFSSASFTLGLSWFAAGIFKKVVLADGIAPYADAVFNAAEKAASNCYDAWIGATCYALQIYFDFSGYSDMAIGLALMFNIALPLNFSSPYQATSLIEFWQRWHMTLSRFLRDYLYVPLGGNRRGKFRQYANLLITMLLGGLWHGAAWNFIIWGAIHGVGLLVNHAVRDIRSKLNDGIPAMPAMIGAAATLLVVIVAWVPFRAHSLNATVVLLKAMATPGGGSDVLKSYEHLYWLVPLSAIALVAPNTAQIFGSDSAQAMLWPRFAVGWRTSVPFGVGLGIAMGLAVALSLTQPTAFLYFRF